MNRGERKRTALHRELWAAVEAELGDQVICARCGTTLKGFDDTCSAVLDDACEGFRRIDEVRSRHYRRLTGVVPQAPAVPRQ